MISESWEVHKKRKLKPQEQQQCEKANVCKQRRNKIKTIKKLHLFKKINRKNTKLLNLYKRIL